MWHDFERPSKEDIDALSVFPTATLHEVLGQTGAMPFHIKPIYPGMRLQGAALTVACPPGDNLSIHAAVEHAHPGDVLVVDFKGYVEAGPFGDILATACQAKGIVGIVIDGCVRDGAVLRDMKFPAFARGLNMKGTNKKLLGSLGSVIVCAGVVVSPGDAVVGDDDGVVVIARDRLKSVIAAAAEREQAEEAMRQQLLAGTTTVDLLKLRPLLGAGK